MNGRRDLSYALFGTRLTAESLPSGLYIVATPIGHLQDMTLRAISTLAAANLVLAEDTRVSKTLLTHYGIATPLAAYHEHNASEMRPKILKRLGDGDVLALISDAGTPLVSDPGYKLVEAVIEAGFPIVPIPGPSAVLTALVASGLPTDRFFFEGFLPPKATARRARLAMLEAIPGTLVFFESPRRVVEMLRDAEEVLGNRTATVARELTKKFETFRRGPLSELCATFEADESIKGEIVVLIAPADPDQPVKAQDADFDAQLKAHLKRLSVKDATAVMVAETGLPRREIYARAIALVREEP